MMSEGDARTTAPSLTSLTDHIKLWAGSWRIAQSGKESACGGVGHERRYFEMAIIAQNSRVGLHDRFRWPFQQLEENVLAANQRASYVISRIIRARD